MKENILFQFKINAQILERRKGRIPYRGSAAAGSQTLPNRKSHRPISTIAGMPEITRYTVISSTQATVTRPKIKKMPCTIFSNALLFFIVTPKYNNTSLRASAHTGVAISVVLGDCHVAALLAMTDI